MNTQEAMNILTQAVASVSAPLEQHKIIQQALQVVARELEPQTGETQGVKDDGTEKNNNK